MTNPGWGGAYGDQPNPPQSVCVRHPDRPTGLACSRCGRPACPQCLQPAAVGQHCVDCVRDGNKNVRTARTVAGAPMTRSAKTPLTFALIAINVVIFGITAAQSGDLMSNFRGSSLADAWALNSLLVADGDVWRLLSSGFIHIGPIHLLVNMFALYIIGRDVELVLGRRRYLAVYFLSGRWFVIAVSTSKFTCQGRELMGISTKAPIFEAIEGAKAGEVIQFNGRTLTVEDVA